MKITVITVGKKFDSAYAELIQQYQKRLNGINVDWRFVSPDHRDSSLEQRQAESKNILTIIPDRAFVVLLDETGKMLTNYQFADTITECRDNARHIVFIIGGAYGVDELVKERVDVIWSLSPLVFPHQMVRLVLIEQLYRSMMILGGHPYHHQ